MENKIIFADGSYIEENKSGLVYVGEKANEIGHIMRKSENYLFESPEQTIKRIKNEIY